MATRTEDVVINIDVENAKSAEREIDGVTESLEGQKEAGDENTAGLEQYSASLIDTAKNTKIFGVSVADMSRALKLTTTSIKTTNIALKAFKIALIATGIGAIVVALGALVAWLTSTRAGVDFVSDAFAVLGEIMKGLRKLLADMGGALIKLFKGDFVGAFNDAKAALSGFNDEIRQNIALRVQLQQLTRDADQFDRDAIVTRARLQREVADLVLKTRDLENTTARERIAALTEATKKQGELNRLNEAAAFSRANIAKANLQQLDESEAAFEDAEEAANNALAAFIQTQKSGSDALRQLQNRVNTERTKLAREQKDAVVEIKREEIDEIVELEIDLQDELDALTDDAIDREERAAIARNNVIFRANQALIADAEATADAKIQLAEFEAQQTTEIFAGLAGGLANLAGQESAAGKAFAIVQAFINMKQGITAALTALTLPGRIAGVAFAITTGLAAIRDIQSVQLPKVQIAHSPFAEGGPIAGPTHTRGGVWLNAEGGEYIINRTAMRDPVNRAIVESINDGKQSAGRTYQDGGFVNTAVIQLMNLEKALENMQPVLILPDLDRAQNVVRVTDEISTLQ